MGGFFLLDKVAKLVDEGSAIKGAYPVKLVKNLDGVGPVDNSPSLTSFTAL